jgi:hypothetical protein
LQLSHRVFIFRFSTLYFLKTLLTSAFLILITNWTESCNKSSSPSQPFEQTPVLYPVQAGVIDEASGIADSYRNPGSLWGIQDSDRPTELYLLGHNGQHGKKIFLKNVTNRDWEELAVSEGPDAGKKYIYIGETGDNNRVFNSYSFYRFEEPSSGVDTISQIDKINFQYPDGPHDAEAFFVEPVTKDIYIITKRDANSKVYRLPYPHSTAGNNTAQLVYELPYTGVVAAAYSFASKELLIKTYTSIYYYRLDASQSIADVLKTSYTTLTYQMEPQGEAVCFSNNNTGFFTLSEKATAMVVNLQFYKRK